MAFSSLSQFIRILEENNELVRVGKFVDPVLEIGEVTDRFAKSKDGGKALLFTENGTEFPVLTNSLGSLKRLSLAHGVHRIETISERIENLFNDIREPRKGFMEKLSLLPKLAKLSGYFPSEIRGKAPVQEIIHRKPDLGILPVLKTWPYDGGRFITLPMVISHDPDSGDRNVGMYRMQIFDKRTTGMHWHRHKTGANHFEKYRKNGLKMPLAVALGGDPVLYYSATAPLPENIDEFLFAGFLRQKSVTLTPAVSQDIMVPAEADIIIEGYIDPSEEKVVEGPFGDHTGFYSLRDYYPAFHVTAITHRKGAVYPATIVGIPPQEDAKIAKLTERIFLMPIRQAIVPELVDMEIPDFGVAHNLSLVKIKKTYPGQARKVMNALWGAGQMMFNKVLLVADADADFTDPDYFPDALDTMEALRDIVYSSGPLDVLDHASDFMGFGGKLGLDLTRKFPEEQNLTQSSPYHLKEIIYNDVKQYISDSFIFKNRHNKAVVAVLAVEKRKEYNKFRLIKSLQEEERYKEVAVFLITDRAVHLKKTREFLWYSLNNIEVNRDVRIVNSDTGILTIIDASAKVSSEDKFPREWPNVVTMNPEIIKKVDEKWSKLGLGKYIPSPSVNYFDLVVTPGASVRRK